MKEAVRRPQATQQDVFVLLAHRPGEARANFGQAPVRLGDRLRKLAFFVMSLNSLELA